MRAETRLTSKQRAAELTAIIDVADDTPRVDALFRALLPPSRRRDVVRLAPSLSHVPRHPQRACMPA